MIGRISYTFWWLYYCRPVSYGQPFSVDANRYHRWRAHRQWLREAREDRSYRNV